MLLSAVLLRLLLAACVALPGTRGQAQPPPCIAPTPAPSPAPAPAPAPVPAPAPAPGVVTGQCAGPEPRWTVSDWWPPGAVFRCGCGWTAGGTARVWNDVRICGAFGDLLYATGAPQLDVHTGNYTFGLFFWPDAHEGWSDAVQNVSSDYCSFNDVRCDPAEGYSYPASGERDFIGVLWSSFPVSNISTLPASFSALAALPGLNTVGFFLSNIVIDPAIFIPMKDTLTDLAVVSITLLDTWPTSLAKLTGLKNLALVGCPLNGTLPPEFSALTQLVSLTVSGTLLPGSIPDSWGNLTALKNLTLSQNSLSGTLPTDILCRMTNLSNVDLSFNDFTGSIPSLSCLSESGKLSLLDLRSNKLSGTIPDDLLPGLDDWWKPVSVGLAGNMLTGTVPRSLAKSGWVRELLLSNPTTVCVPGSAATGVKFNTESWMEAPCALCPAGTFTGSVGAVACEPCAPFSIAPQPGAVACAACPANSRDSSGNTACTCLDGYYDVSFGANSSTPQCASCPDGGACVGGQLLAQESWWRESPSDAVFLKCREGYCMAEAPLPPPIAGVSAGGRRLAQANASADHCADGHGGVLCAVCVDGYTMQGGFCQPCREADVWRSWSRAAKGVTIALFILAGLLLLTLLLLLPLLPAWERALWRCTTMLATAAAAVAGTAGALRRRCTGVAAETGVPTPRSSSAATPRSGEHNDPAAATEDSAASEDAAAGVGSVDGLIDAAQELLAALARPSKILINFFQIVSSFIDTLDVPWPHVFSRIMSRVKVVNIDFLQLPKTACLYPNTPFFQSFQGYTLGATAALAAIGATWLAGRRLLARITLQHAPAADRALRLRRFQTLCLSRALWLLYLLYPGVSAVVIAVFNCRNLPSGRAVLVADHRETCWTRRHWAYVGAGVFWLLAVPFGIPAAFLGLLYHFRVPHLARVKMANAWLREAVEHAWRLGLPQPPCDVQTLGFDTVTDEHLELLVATLVHGKRPASADEDAAALAKPARRSRVSRVSEPMIAPLHPSRRMRSSCFRVVGVGGSGDDGAPPPGARRVALEKALLRWCSTSGVLSLPPLAWAEAEDDAAAAADSHAHAPNARRLRLAFRGSSVVSLAAVSRAELAALEQRALRKVGFLFEAYTLQCWAWEVVELGRKLILTSILALVAPGSATQVTVGVLVAFGMLLLFQRHRPYAAPGLNFIASVAQVNMFFLLFTGLLLKVRINGDATDGRLFNAIVVMLSAVPVALPVALKASAFVGALDGDELDDAMDEAGEDAGADDG